MRWRSSKDETVMCYKAATGGRGLRLAESNPRRFQYGRAVSATNGRGFLLVLRCCYGCADAHQRGFGSHVKPSIRHGGRCMTRLVEGVACEQFVLAIGREDDDFAITRSAENAVA